MRRALEIDLTGSNRGGTMVLAYHMLDDEGIRIAEVMHGNAGDTQCIELSIPGVSVKLPRVHVSASFSALIQAIAHDGNDECKAAFLILRDFVLDYAASRMPVSQLLRLGRHMDNAEDEGFKHGAEHAKAQIREALGV